jgi:hypothetical protein
MLQLQASKQTPHTLYKLLTLQRIALPKIQLSALSFKIVLIKVRPLTYLPSYVHPSCA